jgi:uncharacterized protein YegP (UPF0339 family)
MSRGTGHYSAPKKGKDGQWYFHLKGANGRVVMQSQGYKTEAGANKGIEAAATAAREANHP